MRGMVRLFASMIWLVLAISVVRADDLFVDNVGGDDRHNGRGQRSGADAGPCRTIQRALLLARSGDRIILKNNPAEPYRESISLEGARNSGDGPRSFIIQGNGAVLSGQDFVPPNSWRHVKGDVFAFTPERASHQQLFESDLPVVRRFADITGQPLGLQPKEWALVDRRVLFRVERNRMPQSYHLTYAALPVGITLYNVRNVTIADLIVEGFQLDGINAADTAHNVALLRVTSRGNGRSGVTAAGASRISLDDSLLGSNGQSQLRTEGHSEVYLGNVELLQNPAPALVQDGGRVLVPGGKEFHPQPPAAAAAKAR